MGTSRESTKIELEYNNVIQATRNLDKVLWHHGGTWHQKNHAFEMVKETVEHFDNAWIRFKATVDEYEKEHFADKL